MALQAVLIAIFIAWVVALVFGYRALARSNPANGPRWPRSLPMQLMADRRANALLRSLLTPRQYQQLRRSGYIEVPSPTNPRRTYRIPATGGLVRVYESGAPVADLCLQPVETLPEGDIVVLHKLMIEGDEQEYLAKANHFAPGILMLRPGLI